MARAVSILLVWVGLLFVIAARDHAHAHAVLIEARPADGAVVSEPPRGVLLRFNEPVAPVRVQVLGPDGASVTNAGDLQVQNEQVWIHLPAVLAPGPYVMSYRVISADSHPVSGSLRFAFGTSLAPQGVETRPDTGWNVASAVTRAMFLAMLLLASGGVLALWRLCGFAADAVERERGVLIGAALAALAVGAVHLGVSGGRLSGGGASVLAELQTWRLAATSSVGRSLFVAAVGLLLIAATLPDLARPGARGVAVLGSLIALVSLAFTGHAATASPEWLMMPAVVLHGLCAAFWLGALRPLWSALGSGAGKAVDVARRFSADAVVVVAVLLLLGVLLAVVQVRELDLLWRTTYGVLLLGKIAAVAALLVVAAFNKWSVVGRVEAGQAEASATLRGTIKAEYALFAVILALTASLGQTEPPRTVVTRQAAAQEVGQDVKSTLTEAGYTVTLTVSPAERGHNVVAIDVGGPGGQRIVPVEVDVDLALPASGIEPMRRKAERDPSGWYVYHSDDMTLAGRWRIGVDVLIDDFTKKSFVFDVPIR